MMLGLGASVNPFSSSCWGIGTDMRLDCSGGATNGQLIDCGCFTNMMNITCLGFGTCTEAVTPPATGGGAQSGGSDQTPATAPGNNPAGQPCTATLLPPVCDSYIYLAGILALGAFAWKAFGK